MKRVLITGSAGILGRDLVGVLGNVSTYKIYGCDLIATPWLPESCYVVADLTDPLVLRSTLDQIQPDIIIHCAALVDLNFCEENPKRARLVHEQISRNLAAYYPEHIRFIYISTDSVFDGKCGNYNESDVPCPLNEYARTKWEGERAVVETSSRALILRTNIFGFKNPQGSSFVEWALSNLLNGRAINGFTDIMFNAIYTKYLADVIRQLLETDHCGLLNVASRNSMSKYEFLVALAKAFGVDSSLVNIATSEQIAFKVRRPKKTTLNVDRLQLLIGHVPLIEEGINALRDDYKSYI